MTGKCCVSIYRFCDYFLLSIGTSATDMPGKSWWLTTALLQYVLRNALVVTSTCECQQERRRKVKAAHVAGSFLHEEVLKRWFQVARRGQNSEQDFESVHL